jgi:DNA-binding response OmpR family regulator
VEQDAMGSETKTVLVADDNAAVCEVVTAALEGEDVLVLKAVDGEEACAIARERRPDAIILDLLMPKLDGISALVRLRSEPATRHVPVLMISGMPGKEASRLAAAYGAGEFLVKPFQLGELVARIRALLDRSPAPLARSA